MKNFCSPLSLKIWFVLHISCTIFKSVYFVAILSGYTVTPRFSTFLHLCLFVSLSFLSPFWFIGIRSDREFLYHVIGEVIKAGATGFCIGDTLGCNLPSEFGQLIADIKANTPGVEDVIISTHCHDDLGLATANTLAVCVQFLILCLTVAHTLTVKTKLPNKILHWSLHVLNFRECVQGQD